MTNRSLDSRLRKIEAERDPIIQPTLIVGCDREEAERKLAELEAAGTYRPGWPLLIITTGVPRNGSGVA